MCAAREVVILAIDPSITRTGWVVMTGRGDIKAVGSIAPPPSTKATYRQRVQYVAVQFIPIAGAHRPTHVAMEETLVHGSKTSSLRLAKLNGAIGLAIGVECQDVVFEDMSVSEVRKGVGFKFQVLRGETKDAAAERLKTELLLFAGRMWVDVSFTSVDAAEAAITGLRYARHLSGECPIVVRPRGHKKKKKKDKRGESAVQAGLFGGYNNPPGGG